MIIIAYMRFLDTILELVFPSKCLACSRSGSLLCLECLSDFPEAERKSADWIFPVYDYRHPPVKKALWALKYKGKKVLAEVFAQAVYEKITEELSDLYVLENFTSPLLIPIPLSAKRKRERGFNQSEVLCREILKEHHMRTSTDQSLILELGEKILIKPAETEHQARIRERKSRLRNIAGSFTAINQSRLKGRNVILIDDILTTGATLTEARKVLKLAGARKIVAFTVAH
jgi:competence protein ComFC